MTLNYPPHYVCPISQDLMGHAVKVTDRDINYWFDKPYLEMWRQTEGGDSNPLTMLPGFRGLELIDDLELQAEINDFIRYNNIEIHEEELRLMPNDDIDQIEGDHNLAVELEDNMNLNYIPALPAEAAGIVAEPAGENDEDNDEDDAYDEDEGNHIININNFNNIPINNDIINNIIDNNIPINNNLIDNIINNPINIDNINQNIINNLELGDDDDLYDAVNDVEIDPLENLDIFNQNNILLIQNMLNNQIITIEQLIDHLIHSNQIGNENVIFYLINNNIVSREYINNIINEIHDMINNNNINIMNINNLDDIDAPENMIY